MLLKVLHSKTIHNSSSGQPEPQQGQIRAARVGHADSGNIMWAIAQQVIDKTHLCGLCLQRSTRKVIPPKLPLALLASLSPRPPATLQPSGRSPRSSGRLPPKPIEALLQPSELTPKATGRTPQPTVRLLKLTGRLLMPSDKLQEPSGRPHCHTAGSIGLASKREFDRPMLLSSQSQVGWNSKAQQH